MNKLASDINSKNNRKFKPRKTPRYLPGSVEKAVLRTDLKEYNKHLCKVFYALPKVDDKAPTFHTRKYFKTMEMHNDFFTLKNVDRQNKKLLKIINKINRTKGELDTFNLYAYQNFSKWRFKKLEFEEIKKRNKKLYKKLENAESEYSRAKLDKEWQVTSKKMQRICKYPCDLFKKKSLDKELRKCPSISDRVEPPFSDQERLKYFMEFQIENGLKVGRIVMELYRDFVPNIIETFLDCCESNSFKNSRIEKIYRDKCCVLGNLKKNYKKEESTRRSYSKERYLLKHSKAGVISVVPTNDKNYTGLQFNITFDKMPHFDGKLIVIGNVIWGAVNLFKLNDFGSKFGHPTANIIVSNCGKCVK